MAQDTKCNDAVAIMSIDRVYFPDMMLLPSFSIVSVQDTFGVLRADIDRMVCWTDYFGQTG